MHGSRTACKYRICMQLQPVTSPTGRGDMKKRPAPSARSLKTQMRTEFVCVPYRRRDLKLAGKGSGTNASCRSWRIFLFRGIGLPGHATALCVDASQMCLDAHHPAQIIQGHGLQECENINIAGSIVRAQVRHSNCMRLDGPLSFRPGEDS